MRVLAGPHLRFLMKLHYFTSFLCSIVLLSTLTQCQTVSPEAHTTPAQVSRAPVTVPTAETSPQSPIPTPNAALPGQPSASEPLITAVDLASPSSRPCGDEPWSTTRGIALDLQPRDIDPTTGRWLLTSESGGVYLFESTADGLPGKWLARFCPGSGLPAGKITDAVFGPGPNNISVAMASRGLAHIDIASQTATPVTTLREVTVARTLCWPEHPDRILLLFAPMGPVGDFGGLQWWGESGALPTPALKIPGSPPAYAYRITDAALDHQTGALLLASTAGLLRLGTDGTTEQLTRDQIAALDPTPDGTHVWAGGTEVLHIAPQQRPARLDLGSAPPRHRPGIRDLVAFSDGYLTVNITGTLTRVWTDGPRLLREHTITTVRDPHAALSFGQGTGVIVGTRSSGLYTVQWPTVPAAGAP